MKYMKCVRSLSPEVRAACLVALWAQQLDLPPGNLWELALCRHVLTEWGRLGADNNAWGFVEAKFRIQLGLEDTNG